MGVLQKVRGVCFSSAAIECLRFLSRRVDVWIAHNGFGFVEYENLQSAEDAFKEMNGHVILDRRIRVDYARPENKNTRDLRCYSWFVFFHCFLALLKCSCSVFLMLCSPLSLHDITSRLFTSVLSCLPM